ncbi:MAG: response regulator transcription factor [Prevotella sp.]|nr:response regulator transcription factor [Prevotella sp.]
MILNCAIIDDEPLAAGLIKSYVEKTTFLSLKGVFNSAITAMKELRQNSVDIIFLDIQMPELSGLEFAKILPKETKIIFTTAFNQYALEGYDVNALGYLIKPISYEAFIKVSNKALEWFEMVNRQETASESRFMFVKSDYKLQRINLDDILYIEGLKDYVQIYLENGNKIISLMNMKNLEDYLPSPEFMRTHRSYIVHMTKIDTVDRFRLVAGGKHIPVSESYKEQVQAYIDSHTMI